MSKAIRIEATGGPELLRMADIEVAEPGAGEVAIRHAAIGVNYIDVYHRSGLYPLELPSGIGLEAAGTVTAVGPDVTNLAEGDRVAYASAPVGAYAEQRLMPAARVVKLPVDVSERDAAALMLKGLTAHFLLFRSFAVQRGHNVLVHAAAGGVGSLLCAWGAHLGARIIASVGSREKAEAARAAGAHEVILHREEDIAQRVRDFTEGRGVAVVYDGIGKATFQASLDSLAPLGMLVSYGNASGPLPAFDPAELARRGSLFFTRPSLMDYTKTRADLEAGAEALFAAVENGVLTANIGQTYAMDDAAQAHRDLEASRTTGASLLLP